GHTVRYVAPHEGSVLSSVVVAKQHVQELIAVRSENGYIIGKTLAVQEFEEWSKRDYSRPYADPKSGMLPPKVARMLVHAAVGFHGEGMTILDPFCGMGTILGEASLERCRVIGGDQDTHVISKARKNLEWLATVYQNIDISHSVFYAGDATGVSKHIREASVDAIITEPFMGTTKLGGGSITDAVKIRNIMKGLEKLYIGCLREWHKVLKPSGKVMIAFPEYHLNGKIFAVKKVIDMCEKLGYTNLVGPIEYGRPQAIVKREFYLFEKSSKINN
ncbi:methyltransferase domain-containing protein, partial [Patescibacteria group bacterium]|nr:methyltransferase domain-containing protein [Patescibacteria group bacterium]